MSGRHRKHGARARALPADALSGDLLSIDLLSGDALPVGGEPDLAETLGVRKTLDALRTIAAGLTPTSLLLLRHRDELLDLLMDPLTLYLAGEFPTDLVREFEELLEEPMIRDAVGPLVAAWRAPDPEPPVTEAEIDAAYARFRANVARQSR